MACLLSSSLYSLHLSSSFKGNAVRVNNQSLKQRNAQPLIVRAWVTKEQKIAKYKEKQEGKFERLRLDNLSPQDGSRKNRKRKGRGIAAGQGNSCGFGMRGQKSRSGPGVRKGFEGGQMPLYRRIPKLRGIAGGMKAGLSKYVAVNLRDLENANFKDGDEISLESLKAYGLINPSGRERRLPLKILGDGDLRVKLNIKARAFSEGAKEKLEKAGCTMTVLPGRKKWLKPSVVKNQARADAYFKAKKEAADSSESAESA